MQRKSQIIVFVVIALILVTMAGIIGGSVEGYYYNRVAAEAQRYAKTYAQNMETVIEAGGIASRLLDEKIIAAGQLAVGARKYWSDDLLANIAAATRVDEICAYDARGMILSSSSGKRIGEMADKGQQAYAFLSGTQNSFVDEIRKDEKTGRYCKYGYFRGADGSFVQVGILAETINGILDGFDKQKLLKDMESDPYIQSAFYLEKENEKQVEAAYDQLPVLTNAAREAIANGKELIEPQEKGMTYRVFIPVYASGEKTGTLILRYDLKDTKQLVGIISMVGVAALLFVYCMAVLLSVVNYRKNKRLAQYAYHDPLTDLPNRRKLDEVLRADAAGKGKQALLLVNYRNFKQINMLFGYQYGDKVIKDLAALLLKLHCDAYRLFHLSAERFVFYVTNYGQREELDLLCGKIIQAMNDAMSTRTVGGSIGVVEAEYFQNDLEQLLKCAMLAGESASGSEAFCVGYYSKEMEAQLKRESEIEHELLSTVIKQADSGLYLRYQPILRLKTNRITGLEALARLRCDRLGEISPAEFIPLAEKMQLIVPLGRKILRDACLYLKTLQELGFGNISISVNISGVQLMRDDFVPDTLGIIAETGVNAASLGMEITESAFAGRIGEINAKLRALKAHGIRISIDDFGTGYSSLSRERDLDIDCLKIDKSFIDRLANIPADSAITGDIISMAHRLGHEVVAEGVENAAQKEYLQSKDCDCIQGYLFSKPLLPQEALALLAREAV